MYNQYNIVFTDPALKTRTISGFAESSQEALYKTLTANPELELYEHVQVTKIEGPPQ